MAQAKRSARSAPASPRHAGAEVRSQGDVIRARPYDRSRAPKPIADLQRTAGNRAVTNLLTSGDHTLQRVPVAAEFHETLYNKESACGPGDCAAEGLHRRLTDHGGESGQEAATR